MSFLSSSFSALCATWRALRIPFLIGCGFALGFLVVGRAGDAVLPHTLAIGIVMLWFAAALTLYTGWDYFNAGIRHLVEADEHAP